VTPSASLLRLKTDLVRAGYEKCDQYINQLKAGTLPTQVSLQFPAVLWIRITLMRIRIRLITLMWIRIRLITLMQIRIQIFI
jgi:hypothetical protein